jgi:integrase
MSRERDRASNAGLLPLMEARPLKSGGFSYRYHPIGRKPVGLGRDRADAIRKVLDLNGESTDRGTVNELWRLYTEGKKSKWHKLAATTRDDYTQASIPLLKVFGKMHAAAIRPVHLNKYLRVKREDAPVRANHEIALLSNLLKMAVGRGDIDFNPCQQVQRNEEEPRTEAPEADALAAFLKWAQPIAPTLAGMAEFAALVGARRMEFLRLQWTQVSPEAVRLIRGKQRGKKEVVDVVAMSPALRELLDRLKPARIGPVFPTERRPQQPYTESGFKTMWNRLMLQAVAEEIVSSRFTFHDLRAYYATQHKLQRGALPDLHANPATTARVYDRSKVSKRDAL